MTPLVVDPSGYLKPHHSVGHCLEVFPDVPLGDSGSVSRLELLQDPVGDVVAVAGRSDFWDIEFEGVGHVSFCGGMARQAGSRA